MCTCVLIRLSKVIMYNASSRACTACGSLKTPLLRRREQPFASLEPRLHRIPEPHPKHRRAPTAHSPPTRPSHVPTLSRPPDAESILQPRHRRPRLHLQHLRVLVHARQQPHAHRPPDRLCDFPLVHGAQAGVAAVLDPAHVGHVFGHH